MHQESNLMWATERNNKGGGESGLGVSLEPSSPQHSAIKGVLAKHEGAVLGSGWLLALPSSLEEVSLWLSVRSQLFLSVSDE